MLNGKRIPDALAGGATVSSAGTPVADQNFLPALRELLKAFDYARFGQREVWDFAVEIGTLRSAGLTEADFRWLVCVGHIDHACEVTILGDDSRHFQRTGKLTFTKRTCFVLTQSGAEFTRTRLNGHVPAVLTNPSHYRESENTSGEAVVPVWDAERRELLYRGILVKQFKWPAANQEMILAVFQESSWPARVDDPLPPQPEQDSKRRLHDTIKCLNRNQKRKLIRFYGDGTGEGVLWKLVE